MCVLYTCIEDKLKYSFGIVTCPGPEIIVKGERSPQIVETKHSVYRQTNGLKYYALFLVIYAFPLLPRFRPSKVVVFMAS